MFPFVASENHSYSSSVASVCSLVSVFIFCAGSKDRKGI